VLTVIRRVAHGAAAALTLPARRSPPHRAPHARVYHFAQNAPDVVILLTPLILFIVIIAILCCGSRTTTAIFLTDYRSRHSVLFWTLCARCLSRRLPPHTCSTYLSQHAGNSDNVTCPHLTFNTLPALYTWPRTHTFLIPLYTTSRACPLYSMPAILPAYLCRSSPPTCCTSYSCLCRQPQHHICYLNVPCLQKRLPFYTYSYSFSV